MIDLYIQQELQFELIENEKLIWAGRPYAGIVFRSRDIILIPFSLIWFGVVLTIFFLTGKDGIPWQMALFFIPFLAVGLFVTVGRFFIDGKRRANTTYGITDNRIIIRSGMFSKSVNSFNIKSLSTLA